MNLQPFCFPVTERAVAVDDATSPLIDIDDQDSFLPNGYKAIVREDTNEVISIVKDSYKLVRNSDLIDHLLRELATLSYAFKIDSRHSFVDNSEMRLNIIFPELLFHDKESEIAFGVSVSNSYNSSKSVKVEFSGLRKVCENGLILNTILSSFYSKHTSGFNFEGLGSKLEEAKEYFPSIQERIHRLEHLPVTDVLMEKVSDKISKRLAEQVIAEHERNRIHNCSQWELFNRITNHISHEIEPRLQAKYQHGVSKVFAL
jgi:hypothetical protein